MRFNKINFIGLWAIIRVSQFFFCPGSAMIFAALAFFFVLFVFLVNIFVSIGLSLFLAFVLYFVYVCSSHAPRELESGTAQLVRKSKDVLWRKKFRFVQNEYPAHGSPPTFNYNEIMPGLFLGRLPRNTADLSELKQKGVTGIYGLCWFTSFWSGNFE